MNLVFTCILSLLLPLGEHCKYEGRRWIEFMVRFATHQSKSGFFQCIHLQYRYTLIVKNAGGLAPRNEAPLLMMENIEYPNL